jgi:hypothetical protein
MNETAWLTTRDCQQMVRALNPSRDFRKLNLFVVAVGRSIHRLVPEIESRDVFDWLESHVEGEDQWHTDRLDWDSEGAAFRLESPSRSNYFIWKNKLEELSDEEFDSLASWGTDTPAISYREALLEAAHFANLVVHTQFDVIFQDRFSRFMNPHILREIFGNPFRPVAFDPSSQTSATVSLAQSMYDSRDFAAMPVLADALEEAGCRQEEILGHCRGESATHVRGCWVVDLVLRKA